MKMYPYLCPNETCNPSHEHDNFVNFKPKQQVAFFSPAYPMPRQILYNNDGTIKKCPANAVVKSIMPDFVFAMIVHHMKHQESEDH